MRNCATIPSVNAPVAAGVLPAVEGRHPAARTSATVSSHRERFDAFPVGLEATTLRQAGCLPLRFIGSTREKLFRRILPLAALVFMPLALHAQSPVILSLKTNRLLTWTPGGYTNGVAIMQRSTTLLPGSWSSFSYDVVAYSPTSTLPYPYFTNVAVPAPRSTLMPPSGSPAAFYRVALQTNIPDPSLIMRLSFDDDFVHNGVVLDVSGHANHGLRYGYPDNPETNRWPSTTIGPDGSQAGEFHWYADNWGDYLHSGDYIGVPTVQNFTNMSQATISFWCHYYPFINGGCDCNSTPLQAGQGTGTWTIGRLYDTRTTCEVGLDDANSAIVLSFPDNAPDGDTGGWHHYAVSFDHGSIVGYFDGTNFSPFGSAVVPNQVLTLAGVYLGIGVWTFNVDPWLNFDGHPNNAWMNGALDDIRIYNRALSAPEIFNLYTNFDKQAPTTPQNFRARTDSSSQIELAWDTSVDNFRVDGYRLRRNGAIIADVRGNTHFVDTGLSPLTSYTYTVQAFDPANNVSPPSASVITNTPAAGSPVEVIVDDADGAPWVNVQGTWTAYSSIVPNFWGPDFLNGTSTSGALSVTFRPVLPEAGSYQVYIWSPGDVSYDMSNFAANIPVDIAHGGVTNTVSLNERINYATWNYLGTYAFAAGTNGFVRVRTTGTGSDAVVADAVRFVK